MNLSIKQKLIANIILTMLTIAALISISAIGLSRLADLQDEGAQRADDAVALTEAANIGPRLYQVVADAVINRNLDETRTNWAAIRKDAEAQMATAIKAADTPEEERWTADANAAMQAFFALFEKEMLPLLSSGQVRTETVREIDAKIDEQAEKIHENMAKVSESLRGEMGEADSVYDVANQTTLSNALLVGAIMIAMLSGLSIWILLSVTRPLAKLINVANQLSEGDLTANIEVNSKDETGKLLEAMRGVITTLKTLVSDMKHMSAEHDKGDIDVVMDAGKFKGEYAVMAQGVNDMVNGHIAVKKKAMACVKAFGEGDFDAPLEKFPGKKAFINDTIETVRGNIKGFIADMKHMSKEHDAGDIDVVMDVSKFKGDYAVMAQGVNDMVNGHIAVKKKAMACFTQFGEGNLDAPMEQLPGKKKFINDTIENVRSRIKALVADAAMLAEAAVAGKLETRADASKHLGDYRKIVEGVNATLDAIVAPINDVKEVLTAVSQGDMTRKIEKAYQGDFDELKHTINETLAKLSQVITDVRSAADNLSSASEEVSATAQSLSQGASEQAASVEETSASIEQMSASITQNADNARTTDGMASKASREAQEGGESVKATVAAMKQIADKIGIIDDIAYQTNLLALNAAIEAARAGEQGRGFAVVADEVRTLAGRTQDATRQIQEMIVALQSGAGNSVQAMQQSQKQVRHSVELAEQAGIALKSITEAICTISDMNVQIASAAEEQTSVAENINQNEVRISDASRHAVEAAENIASSSESLAQLAENLSELLSRFKA